MNPNENIHTLAGAYALDALDDLERVRFERHLDACDTCSEEVASFHDTAALLGAVEEMPVSDDLRRSVLDSIEHVRQVGPVTAKVHGIRPRVMSIAAAVFAVLALGAGAFGFNQFQRVGELEPYQELASILQAPDAVVQSQQVDGAQVKVIASPGNGAGAVLASGLDAAPDGHAYQLWLLDADDAATPAGFLEVGADGSGQELMQGDMTDVIAVGVTVEPAGGSDQPTSEPIAVVSLGS